MNPQKKVLGPPLSTQPLKFGPLYTQGRKSEVRIWLDIKTSTLQIDPWEHKNGIRIESDAKQIGFISESYRCSGIDQLVWNFTNKNVSFGVQFKF